MLLHDRAIRGALGTGALGIEPFDEDQLKPSSYDVRLDSQFAMVGAKSRREINPMRDNSERVWWVDVPENDYFLLRPADFVLASTVEVVTMGLSLAGRIEGKSSLGRLGLMVHSTAGFIDPGFSGQITLELSNMLDVPIRLYPGMPIAQICFIQMTGEATSYAVKGKYQGQRGPTPSMYHLNFDRE